MQVMPPLLQVNQPGGHLLIYFPEDGKGQRMVLQSSSCIMFPVQLVPPCAGAGESHFLSRCCFPPPQVFEHKAHGPQVPQLPSTAQAWVLQSLDSEESPVQFLPPCAGVGWEQDRTLSEVPPPHVFEQEDQAAQSVNPPSTGD